MTAELVVTARFSEACLLVISVFFSPPFLPPFLSWPFLRPSATFLKWYSSILCPFLPQHQHCTSLAGFPPVSPLEVPAPLPPRPLPWPPRPLPRCPPGLVTAKALLED